MKEDTCKISRWQVLKQQLNNLGPAAFEEAMRDVQEVHLLDVRTLAEFEAGALPGAEHLDYLGEEFLDRLDGLDPSRTYLVYCRSGRRSLRVCTLMKNAGFSRVYNLDGGLVAWRQRFEDQTAG
jgi:rhodanese-related sulfurtransferase